MSKKKSKIEGVYDALILGIHDYVKKNGFRKIVLGLSGGIDSAVVSTLCAETGIPTIVVGMPINSSPENTKFRSGPSPTTFAWLPAHRVRNLS